MKNYKNLSKEEWRSALVENWLLFVNGREPDNEAFAELYSLCVDSLLSYGASLGVNKDTCEDVVHDLFCYLYIRRRSLRNVHNIVSYLFIAFKNRAINAVKRNSRGTDLGVGFASFSTGVTVMDSLLDDEERETIRRTVEKLLGELSSRQREAVYLRYMLNLDYDEISHVLKMNTDSVRKLVYRALLRLRQANTSKLPLLFFIITPFYHL